MSFVIAAPEALASAASDLASIGSMIGEANAAAVPPTTGVMAAAEDEVSTAIASLFSSHAQDFQALSTQMAAFHQQFVQLMNGGAAQYASTEAANVSAAQALPNFGYGNTGSGNAGFFNYGTFNAGIGNTGSGNVGFFNYGTFNAGIGNTVSGNAGFFNYGTLNAGIGNTGTHNAGIGLTGDNQFGIGPLSIPRSMLIWS